MKCLRKNLVWVMNKMAVVYVSRHSRSFKDLLNNYEENEILQIKNEKNPLSIEGEIRAKKLSEHKELQDIDIIYSSHYVRAMSTAKYIAENNNIKLNIDEHFGERKFGINDWSELPEDFFERQILDWDYKISLGESLNEVSSRMKEALFEILNKYKNQKIMIVSHSTAITAMLKGWCDIKVNNDTKKFNYYFDNELFFDGQWDAPELFRLEFDDKNNLISIKNLKINY